MITALRRHCSPSLVLSALALFFALGGSALAIREGADAKPSPFQQRCATGAVKGIAIVTGDPKRGIENMGTEYSSDANFFGARWSCSGGTVQVRRVEGGGFDVRFVGNAAGTALATPLGGTPGAIAVYRTTEGAFRVSTTKRTDEGRLRTTDDLPFIIVAL